AGANNDSRTNRVLMTVYGTRGAGLESATLDGQPLPPGVVRGGQPVLRPGTEAGLPLWDLTLDLAPGVERVLVLNLVEPTAPGAARVPVQALAKDQALVVQVPTCG
ncbi:MAG: hypothetical protein H7233_06430, partial [Pseudorhodobacter sp.]|nr:hypothetical protein [Frankiaceae bacterium]